MFCSFCLAGREEACVTALVNNASIEGLPKWAWYNPALLARASRVPARAVPCCAGFISLLTSGTACTVYDYHRMEAEGFAREAAKDFLPRGGMFRVMEDDSVTWMPPMVRREVSGRDKDSDDEEDDDNHRRRKLREEDRMKLSRQQTSPLPPPSATKSEREKFTDDIKFRDRSQVESQWINMIRKNFLARCPSPKVKVIQEGNGWRTTLKCPTGPPLPATM